MTEMRQSPRWLPILTVAAVLAFATLLEGPERVVQGKAIVELTTLPQIVSGTSPEAEET